MLQGIKQKLLASGIAAQDFVKSDDRSISAARQDRFGRRTVTVRLATDDEVYDHIMAPRRLKEAPAGTFVWVSESHQCGTSGGGFIGNNPDAAAAKFLELFLAD